MIAGRAHLVVGGAGGLGEHVVGILGMRGGRVVVADLDGAAAERVAAGARARGADATSVEIDVRSESSVAAAVDVADSAGGGIGSVVNAAGIAGRHRIEDLSDAVLAMLLDVNVAGVVRVCRSAVAAMRRRRAGVIVNVASAAAVRPSPGSCGYSASKGAVVAFSRSLAAEVAPEGIRVWAICPPAIETGMYSRMLAAVAHDDDAQRIIDDARRPLGRVVQPDEVADLIAYLIEGRGPPYGAEPYVV
jgi:3-oxoacyl-[acyl-carrier protein] reductase